MKKLTDSYPALAFVDIETTGSHFDRDRITEIGIITLENEAVSIWESLLDPQTFIPPKIQKLTGITPQMVSGQSSFEDLGQQIKQELEGKIFVAHNARFDYGFLKASFKRIGIELKPKVLCTVKLSRLLFPHQARHNLDTIISEHKLTVSARHRALGDADVLLQFWRVCEQRVGKEALLEAVNQLISSPSLPPHINQEHINAIPESPGCYLFYGENKALLYVGKSISMRSRVQGHFQSALTNRKEMKLSLQVHEIDWIKTSGELSALLLESKLIKEHMPLTNIKLRRSEDICVWTVQKDAAGIEKPKLIRYAKRQPEHHDRMFGLFNSRTEAQGYFAAVAKKYRLCHVLLGLEKAEAGNPCFAFQVKKCDGACLGLVSIDAHNQQLLFALSLYKVQAWPYEGAIAIRDGEGMIVVDQWCYVGSADNHEDLEELVNSGNRTFDLDIFKIIKKALRDSHKDQIFVLSSGQKSF